MSGVRRSRSLRAALGAVVVACSLAWGGEEIPFGDAWEWSLPPRRYGQLSQVERVQYEKAEALLRKKEYAAAAVEFEKYATQNPKSAAYSHAMLMQAYGNHMARQRNRAIQLYNEVVDFFGDVPEDAAPAAYLKAQAQIANGDVDAGLLTLRELVEREEFHDQPIVDLALNQLARRAQADGNERAAEQYWRQVVTLFREAFIRPTEAYHAATAALTELYVRQGRYSSVDELLFADVQDARKEAEGADYVYERAEAVFGGLDAKTQRAFLGWWRARRPAFEETGRVVEYLLRALDVSLRAGAEDDWKGFAKAFLGTLINLDGASRDDAVGAFTGRVLAARGTNWNMSEEWSALASMLEKGAATLAEDRQMALYRKVLSQFPEGLPGAWDGARLRDILVARFADMAEAMPEGAGDSSLVWLIEQVRRMGQMDRAMALVGRIYDPAVAMWTRITLLLAQKKFAEAAALCEELEQLDTGSYAARALETRAGLYAEKLARYEDAIRLYNLISDPPRTIWPVATCYERLHAPEKAVAALTEIENFFEKEAPRAAFEKAKVWERAGDAKKAVVECRAVLKKYPRHQVSSQAHQMLERYGIATGGGVMDE